MYDIVTGQEQLKRNFRLFFYEVFFLNYMASRKNLVEMKVSVEAIKDLIGRGQQGYIHLPKKNIPPSRSQNDIFFPPFPI